MASLLPQELPKYKQMKLLPKLQQNYLLLPKQINMYVLKNSNKGDLPLCSYNKQTWVFIYSQSYKDVLTKLG